MRSRPDLIKSTLGSLVLVALAAGPLAAEEAASLYSQLCASCHDKGTERAPTLETLRAMSAERVLAALESGPMLSMAAGRTGVERRAIAEFVAGKPFSQPLDPTPSPQAMCRTGTGGLGNPLSGPRWNAWGANTSNTNRPVVAR